jgi:hypothetical protein
MVRRQECRRYSGKFLTEDKELLARAAGFEKCGKLSDCSQPKLLEISREERHWWLGCASNGFGN